MQRKTALIAICLLPILSRVAAGAEVLRDFGCKEYDSQVPKSITGSVNNVYLETMAFGAAAFTDPPYTIRGQKAGNCQITLTLEAETDDKSVTLCTEKLRICGKDDQNQDPRPLLAGSITGLAPKNNIGRTKQSYLDYPSATVQEASGPLSRPQEKQRTGESRNEAGRQTPQNAGVIQNTDAFYYRDVK